MQIWNGINIPRPVISTPKPCCGILEWRFLPPRDSMRFFAHAAFSSLRAHAAQNHNGRVGLFGSISCRRHERLQCRQGSFNHTSTAKGEPWSHGSPFGSDRLLTRADHATIDSPAPASCGCSPLSMNGMIEKVCPPRCSSFCTAFTRRSPSGVLISSDK